MERKAIYELIDAERQYQDEKWGGPEHDRGHSAWDFAFYCLKFLGKCAAACMSGDNIEAGRQFVKVAALCVAALENVSELQFAQPREVIWSHDAKSGCWAARYLAEDQPHWYTTEELPGTDEGLQAAIDEYRAAHGREPLPEVI